MFRTLSVFSLLISTSVFAQTPAPSPDLTSMFPGYGPSIINTKEELDTLFEGMASGFKEDRSFLGVFKTEEVSQCYGRAELWVYDWHRNHHIEAQKVFVFYTHQFKEDNFKITKKKFGWWFHVAPTLLAKNPTTGQAEEWVMDPEFSDHPMKMKEWTDLFVATKRKCAEWVPYEKFKNEVEAGDDAVWAKEHCYLVRAPGTDLEPQDIAARQLGKRTGYEYTKADLAEALIAPTKDELKEFQDRLGLQGLKPKKKPDPTEKPKPRRGRH